jgi:predicted ArsR family transcriptional regulator
VAGRRHSAGAGVSADREAGHGTDSGRRRVLDVLRAAPAGLGVTALAEQVGLHPNTVRFHLNRLVAAGLATRQVEQPHRPGRPRLTFSAAGNQDEDGGRRNYQLLADMLAGHLAQVAPDPAGHAADLGRAWGRYLAVRPAPGHRVTTEESTGELLRVLDDIGFSPALESDPGAPGTTSAALDTTSASLETGSAALDTASASLETGRTGTRVLLRHCPFLEVARAHREVVCAVHLGVMQGVLDELRAPLEATELNPLVEPSLCVAHLSRRSAPQPLGA